MTRDESLAHLKKYKNDKDGWNVWANELLKEKNNSDDWKNRASLDFSEHEFEFMEFFVGLIFPANLTYG